MGGITCDILVVNFGTPITSVALLRYFIVFLPVRWSSLSLFPRTFQLFWNISWFQADLALHLFQVLWNTVDILLDNLFFFILYKSQNIITLLFNYLYPWGDVSHKVFNVSLTVSLECFFMKAKTYNYYFLPTIAT